MSPLSNVCLRLLDEGALEELALPAEDSQFYPSPNVLFCFSLVTTIMLKKTLKCVHESVKLLQPVPNLKPICLNSSITFN